MVNVARVDELTAPLEYPVSLAEAKEHLYVSISDDDDLISAIIIASTRAIEQRMHAATVKRSYSATYDSFQEHVITLPVGRLVSVTSIAYTDANGDAQTMDSSDYQVDTSGMRGRVSPASGTLWPTTQDDTLGAVTITFVAGYDDANSVPQNIKAAIFLMIGHLYENREAVVTSGTPKAILFGIDSLLDTSTTFQVL